jgi:hypothetical protein
MPASPLEVSRSSAVLGRVGRSDISTGRFRRGVAAGFGEENYERSLP